MTSSHLTDLWRKAADDLDLEIVAPYELVLSSGRKVRAALAIMHFGAEKGMLILTNLAYSQALVEELMEAGFGFSVMSEPGPDVGYVRENYVEVLNDWGWSGSESDRPAWLNQTK